MTTMFEFKIIQSPDRSQNGTYEHAGDELVFGSSEGEMVIDDPHLGPSQVRIYFDGPNALVQNLYPDCEVRVNQHTLKKNETLPLKQRDSIYMGKSVVSFTKVKKGPLDPPAIDEASQKGIEQFQENSRERAVYEALELLEKGPAAKPGATPPLPPKPGEKPSVPPPLPPTRK